jgi:ribA/ribD-fused uncharacterized protein
MHKKFVKYLWYLLIGISYAIHAMGPQTIPLKDIVFNVLGSTEQNFRTFFGWQNGKLTQNLFWFHQPNMNQWLNQHAFRWTIFQGTFNFYTIQDLRNNTANPQPLSNPRLTILLYNPQDERATDIRYLMAEPNNKNALFQIASTPSVVEGGMIDSNALLEQMIPHAVQGEFASFATMGATIWRKYFLPTFDFGTNYFANRFFYLFHKFNRIPIQYPQAFDPLTGRFWQLGTDQFGYPYGWLSYQDRGNTYYVLIRKIDNATIEYITGSYQMSQTGQPIINPSTFQKLPKGLYHYFNGTVASAQGAQVTPYAQGWWIPARQQFWNEQLAHYIHPTQELANLFTQARRQTAPQIDLDQLAQNSYTNNDIPHIGIALHDNVIVTNGYGPSGRDPNALQEIIPLDRDQRVSLALTTAFSLRSAIQKWGNVHSIPANVRNFAYMINQASYEATLRLGHMARKPTIFLTLMGASSFRNDIMWIANGIDRMAHFIKQAGLNVILIYRPDTQVNTRWTQGDIQFLQRMLQVSDFVNNTNMSQIPAVTQDIQQYVNALWTNNVVQASHFANQLNYYFKTVQPQTHIPQQQVIQQPSWQTVPNNWFGIPGAIYFYDRNQPYFEFTNFFESPIWLDNKWWPTTEHYYQAAKFSHNHQLQIQIQQARSARDAFNIAQQNRNQIRRDWQQVNLGIMLNALRAKFAQNQNLKTLLLSTGNAPLVENAGANDTFFGAGADGKGTNHLGRLLMHVRAELAGQIPYGTPYQPGPGTPQVAQQVQPQVIAPAQQQPRQPRRPARQSQPRRKGQPRRRGRRG